MNKHSMSKMKSIKNIASYVVLILLSVIWMIPVFWVVMTSLRKESGAYTSYFFPKGLTLDNYIKLLTDHSQFYFLRWFTNTLFVAVLSCILSTFFVLSVSYVMSRMRFPMRKALMNIALILGMFPGFMSMIAVYYILKGIGITQSLLALVMVYSGGSGLGFFIAKGFFDTIPRTLDEAAYIDGATRAQIFSRITLPLSKPIIVYTILTAFLAPWLDFIFASVIMGDNYKNYTIALGLFKMMEREFINDYYTRFAAGSVLISIPIAALFISMQKYYVEGISGGAVKG